MRKLLTGLFRPIRFAQPVRRAAATVPTVPDAVIRGLFRRSSWLVRLLLVAQGLMLGGYVLLMVSPVHWLNGFRDEVVANLTLALPGVLLLAKARSMVATVQRQDGVRAVRGVSEMAGSVNTTRRGYALLGVGCLTFAAGNVAYSWWITNIDPVPMPSWADAGYFGSYPFLGAGTLLLARAELGQRLPGGIWLDGLTGMLGTATLGSALGLRVILSQLSGAPAALITNAAYPILDLLLVSMVVGVVALRGGNPSPIWWWLGGGLAVYAAGDTIYLWRSAAGSYNLGTPLDLTWACGLNLIAVTVWCRPSGGSRPKVTGRAEIVLPVGASIVALAILIANDWVVVPWYSVALAGATLLAALSRTVAAFRAAHLLTESRAQARTDDLTGLGNRRGFYEHAEAELQRAGDGGVLSLVLLDLDRFKEINDSLGHHAGDQLLREVSARLSSGLRPGDYLARLGGDEFVTVLPDADAGRALDVAGRLARVLTEPFRLDGLDLQVSASVGVAASPEHAEDVSGLLQRADVAMYQAKASGTGVSVYDAARDEQTRDRLSIIKQLRHALDQDQLELHYQPQCDVRTGAVLGVEALVRWQHPDRGLLYPDAFLPLVEQTGLMPALTLQVLDRAVEQCGRWRLDGRDLTMSVNLSVSNLLDERLPSQVATTLAKHGVPAASLLLEVTENTLMVNPERATHTLHVLHDLGVGLSIDDYGTGYSSLAYLRDLPVDELKLDRSFLHAAIPGSRASAIVRSTIELAHALRLRMVAEGVEDASALQLLQKENCDIAQGYYFTRALPAADLTRWLNAHRPATPNGEPFTVFDILTT